MGIHIGENGEKVVSWTSPSYVDGKLVNIEFVHVERHDHMCSNGIPGTGGYWVYDAQGIELCKVCESCRNEKLSRYRPEIIEGYDQNDVDEPINPDY